jgi:hypothetical protein
VASSLDHAAPLAERQLFVAQQAHSCLDRGFYSAGAKREPQPTARALRAPVECVRWLAMRAPVRVFFSDHAVERARQYGISETDIGDAILDGHEESRRNQGSGDWFVTRGRLAVIYNWPDGDDHTAARVVTLWWE